MPPKSNKSKRNQPGLEEPPPYSAKDQELEAAEAPLQCHLEVECETTFLVSSSSSKLFST